MLALSGRAFATQQTHYFAQYNPPLTEAVIYAGDDAGGATPLFSFSLGDLSHFVHDIESDGTDIYCLVGDFFGTGQQIYRGTQVFANVANAHALAVDGDTIYTKEGNGSSGAIVAFSKITGSRHILFEIASGYVFDIEARQGSVYWSELTITGSLSQARILKDGEQVFAGPLWSDDDEDQFTIEGIDVTPCGRIFAICADSPFPCGVFEGPRIIEVLPGGAQVELFSLGDECEVCPGLGDLEVRESADGLDVYANIRTKGPNAIFKNSNALRCQIFSSALGLVPYLAGPCGGRLAPIALPYGGQFRRVDMHGIPMPERNPAGKAEDDRQDSAIYVDSFSLEPHMSCSDVRLPVEGGDLELEFRRTAGVASRRVSTVVQSQPITYPSDNIMGPGWATNLSTRVIIAQDGELGEFFASAVDEVGVGYRYVDNGLTGMEHAFPPDAYYSLNNQAEGATMYRAGPTSLVLEKTFGTMLTYQLLGRFFSPGGGGRQEEYYRLASVEDRNGDRLVWAYLSDDPLSREAFHVQEIFEEAHPERRISFSYEPGTGGNGTDWGDRLIEVTDPLGHVTQYEYGPSGGVDGRFLIAVTREPVLDGESGVVSAPRTTFTYRVADLAVEETANPLSPPASDPLTKNRFVGLATVTDPRGHVTTFNYGDDYFPSSIVQGLNPSLYAVRPYLTSLSTDDGQVTFGRVTATHESVITTVTDTRGNETRYEFSGHIESASNRIGKALYITELRRTTPIGTVRYEWSNDPFSNLELVEDLNGNTTAYSYETEVSRKSGQPTLEVATDASSGATITTSYDYGVFSRLQATADGEAKSTSYTLDAAGNRIRINKELGSITRYEYAPDGFVEETTDPDGRRTEYARSFNAGDMERYYRVTETVRGHGDVSLVTVRTYDVMGHLVQVTDPNGNDYGYGYDDLYRLVERREPLSGSSSTTYTLNGDPVEETDFLGHKTKRFYDSMNRVREERRPEGIVTRWTHGPAGETLTRTDPEGCVYRYRYDEALRLVQTDFDLGGFNYHEVREYGRNSGAGCFSYVGGYQPTRITNRRGYHTDTEYDGFYRPVQVIRRLSRATGHGAPPGPSEPTIDYAYNRVHNVVRQTIHGEQDAGGDRVIYSVYDDLHRKVGAALDLDRDGGPYGGASGIVGGGAAFVGDSDDQVTVLHLDLHGNQVGVRDPEGHLTETVFDGANRPTLVRQPAVAAGVPVTTTAYDDNGNAILITDPNGNRTHIEYDDRNRETLRILDLDRDGVFEPAFNGDDVVTAQGYDLMDNVKSRTDSRGHTYDFEYDDANREIERRGPAVQDPENSHAFTRPKWSTGYDRNSNRIEETDPRGVVRRREYDPLNRLKSETAAFGTPDALLTSYTYDENDNRVSQTLHNEPYGIQTTEFGFDPVDRQITETWPGGAQVLQDHYRNDLLRSRTDPKGQLREFRYDTAGRQADVRFIGDGGLEEQRLFTYDRADHVLTVEDNFPAVGGKHVTSTRGYDALYRLIRETQIYVDPPRGISYSYTVVHTYDKKGNQTSTAYPRTSRVVRRSFDAADRLRVIKDEGSPTNALDDLVTRYEYDAVGNVLVCLAPNGVRTTKIFDALDRVISTVAAVRGSVVYGALTTFDLVGNRRTIKEQVQGQPGRVLRYGYDAQYRIIGESTGSEFMLFAYDAAGNRLEEKNGTDVTLYSYNERNELETSLGASGLTSYSYDANGNLLERSSPSGVETYTWDTSDRLVASSRNDSPIFAAQYDYRSRRLLKEEGSTRTFFVHTEGLPLEEVTPNDGKVQVEFVHGVDMGGGVGAILYGVHPGTGRGGKVLQASRYEFFTSNHIGHTVALTNLQGRATRTELFDAFSVSVSTTGSSNNTRRAYTKERDASLGFDNHGFRYYDPATGRYIGRDPAGYVDGLNGYLHTANNPVNRFDALGLEWSALPLAALRGGWSGVRNLAEGGWMLAKASQFNPDIASQALAQRTLLRSVATIPSSLVQVPGKAAAGWSRISTGEVSASELVEAVSQAAVEWGAPVALGKLARLGLASEAVSRVEKEVGTLARSIEGAGDVQVPKPNAAQRLPQMKGSSVASAEQTLIEYEFSQEHVTSSAGRNQTWRHADGSEVRIHPYGNQTASAYRSANNAHIHKQDPIGSQLSDRGIPSADPALTHIGIRNPADLPLVRNRPHGAGSE